MDSAYKLAIEIVANAKNFETNVQKAGGDIDEMIGKTREATDQNSEFAGSFSKVGSSVSKFLGVASAVVGSLAFIKSSMQAVEGPGDKLEEVIGGAKESVFELQRSIATVDFSNFIENLKQGYERGKEFTAMMDALADKAAYSDYIVAGLRAQSAELQETIKNKTLDLSLRRKYAEDRNKIEEDIMKRTQEIAQKTFNIEKRQWEGRNKMSADEAVKLYERIDRMSAGLQDTLARMFDTADKFKDKIAKTTYLSQQGIAHAIPQEVIDSYRGYYDLLDKGEKDVLVKLFTTYKNLDQVRFESQRTYNLAVRETSMLLNAEDSMLKKVIERAKEMSGLSGLKQPGVGSQPLNSMLPNNLMPTNNSFDPSKISEIDAAVTKLIEKSTWLSTFQPFDTLKNGLIDLNETLVQGGNSFKDYARNVVSASKQIIGALLAESVATAISSALKTAKSFGPAGIFMIPLLAGAAAGLAKSAFMSLIPSFANGALAYGPTVAQVGEYPGAQNDPEVISPLSKLKDIIGAGQVMMPQRARLQVEAGGNLMAYFEFQQNKLNNFR